LDIYKYLVNIIIDHNPTENCIYKWDEKLKKRIPEYKSLFWKIWKWMPIWNYSSQFFSNIYMNDLDIYIKSLWFENHVRYVDDLVIFWNNREELKNLELKINNFLKKDCKMSLCDEKTSILYPIIFLLWLCIFSVLHIFYRQYNIY
jgi:hypothetical protein